MSDLPFLAEQDEEFQMLREVAERMTHMLTQAKQKGEKLDKRQISGKVTENVIRDYLDGKDFNVSRNRVFINPLDIEIDLLLLKNGIRRNEKCYSSNDVYMVLEIKNNAVVAKRNKVKIEPSEIIKENFKQLKQEVNVNRFAVVVLSEKLLGKPYKYYITGEKIHNESWIERENCRVFTLIARKKSAKDLDRVDVIMDMLHNHELWKTGELEKLLSYLKK